MAAAYWNIGKLLFEAGGENERSAYGIKLNAVSDSDAVDTVD